METATEERTAPEAVQEDDGLGEASIDDGTGIPGGAQPGDDGYVPPPEGEESPAGEPPTPAAELPDDGAEDEAPKTELTIGSNRQLGLKVGGRVPDSCVLKLKGGKIELAGQFDRSDRFLTVSTLQVTGDNDQDTINKLSGEVKSTSKAQSATLCGILRLEEYLEQRLPESLVKPVFEALELELPEAE
jgi:hypothetical protein